MRHVNDPQRQLLQMLQLRRHVGLQLNTAAKHQIFREDKTKEGFVGAGPAVAGPAPFFRAAGSRPARSDLGRGAACCAPACHNVSPANACIVRSPPVKTHASGTPADLRNDRTAAYPISITATSITSHRKISCVSVHGRGSTQSVFVSSGPSCPATATNCAAFTRRAKSYSAPSARSCP